ncbi:hypothetical protein DUT91_23715 [Phyllobacterium salinisoli]|uniref:Uncharacterized protein n=1 Tax=Phyllobacterium salinisoli TaxID=1899321 RepID=A0A368JYG1_9HYPH|nr:hypothetical protein DUT91_23715 [Phyllobacterium salinisoli]
MVAAGICRLHTHLSVDLDILNPAVAPNVSGPIGGGWSVEQLIATIRSILRAETVNSVSFVEAGPTERPGSRVNCRGNPIRIERVIPNVT